MFGVVNIIDILRLVVRVEEELPQPCTQKHRWYEAGHGLRQAYVEKGTIKGEEHNDETTILPVPTLSRDTPALLSDPTSCALVPVMGH